jgi:adenylosuccinate synthase
MTATIIIGAQWGDEGKGRVADWLAGQSDIVARYAGGDNAGHTVNVGDAIYKLHLVPSGILHERVLCVLGNGMVINPVNLVEEIRLLQTQGVLITPERLAISTRAHLITPAHIALDAASEKARGSSAIGTTLRGIGPAYLDKTGRKGLRAGMMQDEESFVEAMIAHIEAANDSLAAPDRLDPNEKAQAYVSAAYFLKPYLRDTARLLHERLHDGATVLCEGAQGTMLDVDHGDYPYVTSSSPTIGGVLTGLGIGARHVERVIGVAKAYSTRVGAGPMPTELQGAVADRLRGTGENFWDEFGTTTGRPRRCGWLDAVVLRYAAAVNGFTELIVTKLDIFTGFESLKVAVAYEIDDERVEWLPAHADESARATPVYETLPGWDADVSAVRRWDDLPENARRYIDFVSAITGVPIQTVSVGPERDQLVHRI